VPYHYLLRFIETGRDAQRQKQPRDLATQLPGAAVETMPGRLFVTAETDLEERIAGLHGVSSFSPCVPSSLGDLEANLARLDLAAARTFAVKVKRLGEHEFSSLALAQKLATALLARWPHLRADLKHPDVTVGVEIRDGRAWLYDRVIQGVDRRGAPVPKLDGPPRFVADQMLGRLAAWLRMLGFDTLYAWDIADSEVVRRANSEGRVVLTRDRPLSRNRAVRVLFVTSRDVEAQVREVLTALGLRVSRRELLSRCSLCNDALVPVEKAAIAGRVAPAAYERHDQFATCARCDKVYWAGGHYRRVLEVLGDLLV
jgi:uncharacterized protein with PIN domain